MQNPIIQKYFNPKHKYLRFFKPTFKHHIYKIKIPASKSLSIRALILAAMNQVDTEIFNILESDDVYFCIKALQTLKTNIKINDKKNSVFIKGSESLRSFNNLTNPLAYPKSYNSSTTDDTDKDSIKVYLAGSGISARFLLATIALNNNFNKTVCLYGDKTLKNRDFLTLINLLKTIDQRLNISFNNKGFPIKIHNNNLDMLELEKANFKNDKISHKKAKNTIKLAWNQSSQYLSALLIALRQKKQNYQIILNKAPIHHMYVNMTIQMINFFSNANIVSHNDTFNKFYINNSYHTNLKTISSSPSQKTKQILIESDLSSLCYIILLSVLHNIKIVIKNIPKYTYQADLHMLYVMQKMGIKFNVLPKFYKFNQKLNYNKNDNHNLNISAKNSFELTLKTYPHKNSLLSGGFDVDISTMADQALTLAVLALFAHKPMTLKNTELLQGHECNRLHALIHILTKLRINFNKKAHDLTIYPKFKLDCDYWQSQKNQYQNLVIPSFNDHRVAMSFSILSSKIPGLIIDNPFCVTKTYPGFYQDLSNMGINFDFFS